MNGQRVYVFKEALERLRHPEVKRQIIWLIEHPLNIKQTKKIEPKAVLQTVR